MKVIHIVEAFGSGTFNFISDLTLNLPDYEYIIIHGKRIETPLDYHNHFPEGTQFVFWTNATRELSLKKDISALLELINILKPLKNADLIHLHSSKAGFLGRIAARLLGMQGKVIYTPHAASFLRLDIPPWKQRLFILFEKIASIFGGRIIACSKSEAEAFEKIGLHPIYINNSVALKTAFFAIKKSEKFITIATIGRISHQKNPIQFNQIALHYLANPIINFLWIGDGELRDVLQSKNIEVTGWLDKDAALTQLKKADIYLSTSLWEGLPVSVLQAMYLKKPLVLSDCVGNRDLITDNGFLCKEDIDFLHAIDALISNAHLRQELGDNAFTLYQKNFSIEQWVIDYKKAYLEVAKIK